MNDIRAKHKRQTPATPIVTNRDRGRGPDSPGLQNSGRNMRRNSTRVIVVKHAFRQNQKAANPTINNELAALSRMFTLSMRAGKAAGKPYVGKLKTNNARKRFFERDQFEAVLKHLPGYLRAVAEAAYITGWRVHNELLKREKKHVDLKAGWLRLEPGETKNRDGRNFPLTPRLREVLEARIEQTEALQRAEGKIIPWLFHREGNPIKNFRRAWLTALVKAGFGTEVRDARGKLIKKVASVSLMTSGERLSGILNGPASRDPMQWRWSGTGRKAFIRAMRSVMSNH